MKCPCLLCCMLFLTLLGDAHVEAQPNKLPRLPGAALLVGYNSLFAGSPSEFLAVTTPGATFMVLPEAGRPETRNSRPTYPSISSDGTLVSCLRVKPGDLPREVVATYSTLDKKWTEYTEAFDVLGVALSPDKSQLAFVSVAKEGDRACLYLLNTRTGVTRTLSTSMLTAAWLGLLTESTLRTRFKSHP